MIRKTIIGCVCAMILSTGAYAGQYKTVVPENGVIKLNMKEISDGTAHFFGVMVQGKEVRFFVIKSKDGVIRTAFDACDVCYPAKKGYSRGGDFMICNNCGRKFNISKIGVIEGGCNPSPLESKTKGAHLIFQMKSLESGVNYF